MNIGDKVATVRPKNESDDWEEEAKQHRVFGEAGIILKESNAHGEIYYVVYVNRDGGGWFEPRELVQMDKFEVGCRVRHVTKKEFVGEVVEILNDVIINREKVRLYKVKWDYPWMIPMRWFDEKYSCANEDRAGYKNDELEII
jgi:hypothetical protein